MLVKKVLDLYLVSKLVVGSGEQDIIFPEFVALKIMHRYATSLIWENLVCK